MSDLTYRLEVRPLYTGRDTPWAPVPGSEFTTFEDRLDHLRAAAEAAPPENIFRISPGRPGSAPSFMPWVIAAARGVGGGEDVVFAEGGAEWWGKARAPYGLVNAMVETFPRIAVAALCDAIAMTMPLGRPCPYVDEGVQHLQRWVASPATAEGEEPAAERCARWIAQVLAGPPYHLLDADRARAFLFAESLTRKGPQAWRYFGPTEEHTIRLALTPRGYIAAAVSACINHIIEATWSGIIHDREGASWLALDEWITSHPLCPREYLGRRRDLPPPRLRYGVDPNVHFVESWLARRAQLTVTAELYMLAKVVDGARDRANDAQSISRIRGHRADSVVLDEALWRTW